MDRQPKPQKGQNGHVMVEQVGQFMDQQDPTKPKRPHVIFRVRNNYAVEKMTTAYLERCSQNGYKLPAGCTFTFTFEGNNIGCDNGSTFEELRIPIIKELASVPRMVGDGAIKAIVTKEKVDGAHVLFQWDKKLDVWV